MIEAEPIEQDILNGNFMLINQKGIKLDRSRDLKAIGEIIGHYKSDVLIIDPMYKFHSGNENLVTDMTRLFDNLDQLISDHECSIVIVHHFGKPSTDQKREGAMQLRGSTTIFDYADSYISLNRKSGKEPRNYIKATFELRNDEDPDPLFLYRNPDSLWYEVLGDDSQAKVTVHDVVDVLSHNGNRLMQKELILKLKDKTGSGERTIKDAINKAEALKKVRSHTMSGKGKPKMVYLPGQNQGVI